MMHTLWRDGKTRSASGARSGSGRLVNAGPRPRFVQAPERSVTVETILPASQTGRPCSIARDTARRHRFFHWPLEFPMCSMTVAALLPRASMR